MNLVVYGGFIGVFALPWVARVTGITWTEVAILMAAHLGWMLVSAWLVAPRAYTSRRAFDIQVIGNAVLGVAIASAFPVLGNAPGTLLWGALIFYAAMNGTIMDFEPSISLHGLHIAGPLATIPVFLANGAPEWSIAGPLLAALFSASGYHLTATSAADARRFKNLANEAERRAAEQRLARDLHDVVGSTLGTVKAYADMLATAAPAVAIPLSNVAQHGIDDLRGILDALAPPPQADLESAITSIARRLVPPTIEVSVAGNWPTGVAGPLRVGIARIVHEALHNAVRHARPTTIAITCSRSSGAHAIEIRDNGIGFMPADDSDGRGLATMRARASELAGTLTITSSDSGTAVVATFPLAMSHAA
jgi:signal transduction histidine kinase